MVDCLFLLYSDSIIIDEKVVVKQGMYCFQNNSILHSCIILILIFSCLSSVCVPTLTDNSNYISVIAITIAADTLSINITFADVGRAYST